MNVLIACEESQTELKQFLENKHNAFSCDIQPCSGGITSRHIHADALDVLYPPVTFKTQDGAEHFIDKWDLIIAHPPCTYLSNVTAPQLTPWRMIKMKEAREFFMKFYNAPCEKIAVENPLPLKAANLPPYSQIIHPYMFSDQENFTKRTCLWLKNLPKLKGYYEKRPAIQAFMSNSKVNGKFGKATGSVNRSKGFVGIARAMADQWGGEA